MLLRKHLALITEASTTETCRHWHSGKTHASTSGRCASKTVKEFEVVTIKEDTHEKDKFIPSEINVELPHDTVYAGKGVHVI